MAKLYFYYSAINAGKTTQVPSFLLRCLLAQDASHSGIRLEIG